MKKSIITRLFISHIAVILVTTVTLGLLMSFLVRSHVVETRCSDLLAKAGTTAELVVQDLQNGVRPDEEKLKLLGDLAGATVWLTDQYGAVIAGTPPKRWAQKFPEAPQQLEKLIEGNPQVWVRTSRKFQDRSIVVATPVPGAPAPTALFLYTPIAGVNKSIHALEKLLLYSLGLGILVAIILGFVMSRSLTRPIADISQAAARFAKGDFSSRTTAVGADEIGRLGHTFNTMADSLASAEQRRREFLADVSHELKTPVASIQAMAEALADGVANTHEQQRRYLSNIIGDSKRIDRLIRDLLDLAQLEAGELSIHPISMDLTAFLRQASDRFIPLTAGKNVRLQFNLPPASVMVTADPDRLTQVLVNLISNAARYAPEGSSVDINLATHSDYAVISVTDYGIGIPAADLPYVWDRFYRVDKSRSRSAGGTGLGLSITRELVKAMGGDVDASSIPGQKTTFAVTLPLSK